MCIAQNPFWQNSPGSLGGGHGAHLSCVDDPSMTLRGPKRAPRGPQQQETHEHLKCILLLGPSRSLLGACLSPSCFLLPFPYARLISPSPSPFLSLSLSILPPGFFLAEPLPSRSSYLSPASQTSRVSCAQQSLHEAAALHQLHHISSYLLTSYHFKGHLGTRSPENPHEIPTKSPSPKNPHKIPTKSPRRARNWAVSAASRAESPRNPQKIPTESPR